LVTHSDGIVTLVRVYLSKKWPARHPGSLAEKTACYPTKNNNRYSVLLDSLRFDQIDSRQNMQMGAKKFCILGLA
jgi:hypothetical protein